MINLYEKINKNLKKGESVLYTVNYNEAEVCLKNSVFPNFEVIEINLNKLKEFQKYRLETVQKMTIIRTNSHFEITVTLGSTENGKLNGYEYVYNINHKNELLKSTKEKISSNGDYNQKIEQPEDIDVIALYYIIENISNFNEDKRDIFNLNFDIDIDKFPIFKDFILNINLLNKEIDNKNNTVNMKVTKNKL